MDNLFFIFQEGNDRNPNYIIDNTGKSYMVVNNLVPSLYLVRFEENGEVKETFFKSDYNPFLNDSNLISGKFWDKVFPAYSFSIYGSKFAILNEELANKESTLCLFDLEKQNKINNSTISNDEIEKLGNPISTYNKNAVISVLSGSDNLFEYFKKYGITENQENKQILFSLFNKVVNAEDDIKFENMRNVLYPANENKKTGGTFGE